MCLDPGASGLGKLTIDKILNTPSHSISQLEDELRLTRAQLVHHNDSDILKADISEQGEVQSKKSAMDTMTSTSPIYYNRVCL